MTTMPDVAGGWVRLLLGALEGILGGKLYIWGVVGYVTPIWDVLAPEGERGEAAEHVYGPILINFFPIRQVVPGGLAQARFCSCARCVPFFMEKIVYCSKYSILTYILLFFKCLGENGWMAQDGFGWCLPN